MTKLITTYLPHRLPQSLDAMEITDGRRFVLDYLTEIFEASGYSFKRTHLGAAVATKKWKFELLNDRLDPTIFCFVEYRPKQQDVVFEYTGLKTFPHFVRQSLCDPRFAKLVEAWLREAKNGTLLEQCEALRDKNLKRSRFYSPMTRTPCAIPPSPCDTTHRAWSNGGAPPPTTDPKGR